MTTIPTIKDLVESIKNKIRDDMTEFQYLYDELKARKNPNVALGDLTEIIGGIL